jgi:hypothetical protein
MNPGQNEASAEMLRWFAAANGAPATVFSTVRALPDSGQQRVAVAEARGAATHFASNKWIWEDP